MFVGGLLVENVDLRRLGRIASGNDVLGDCPEMMLKDKVALIYGAAAAIGGAVALAFAREGAKLFL
jgi:hypothetical protein